MIVDGDEFWGRLRAALGWASGEDGDPEVGLRLAGALWRFCHTRGHYGEGREWLEGTLARSEGSPPALRAKALTGAGVLAFLQCAYERATARLEATLTSHAPSSGLPDYILEAFTAGVGYAVNRSLVGVLRPPDDVAEEIRLEGEVLQTSRDHESFLVNYQTPVDIGPGETRRLTGRFAVPGAVRCGPRSCSYRLHVLRQPVAHPDHVEVRVEIPPGWTAAGPRSFEGPLTEDLVLEVEMRRSFPAWVYRRALSALGR
jgi:hypothetical protein